MDILKDLFRSHSVSQLGILVAQRWGISMSTTHRLAGKSYIEVYPHTALLRLLNADYRIPYKVSNTTKYWKHLSLEDRKQNLV